MPTIASMLQFATRGIEAMWRHERPSVDDQTQVAVCVELEPEITNRPPTWLTDGDRAYVPVTRRPAGTATDVHVRPVVDTSTRARDGDRQSKPTATIRVDVAAIEVAQKDDTAVCNGATDHVRPVED